MKMLDGALGRQSEELSTSTRINAVIALYPKEVLFDYYTRDRVMSETAKREWVEPDLRVIWDRPASP
jgi:hypothetical protein